MFAGRWKCDAAGCPRTVEYDGSSDSLFCVQRRNHARQGLVFTRALLDKLFSFIITARTTYTASTRHLSADVRCFNLRRQDVAKLGTAMLRIFLIRPETGRCPICGPCPEFIVIDGQALGCKDPDDSNPSCLEVECPVLDIPASKLCIVEDPPLRATITKVLRSASLITGTQVQLLRKWSLQTVSNGEHSAEAGAASLFFHIFPLGGRPGAPPRPERPARSGALGPSIQRPPSLEPLLGERGKKQKAAGNLSSLESALRKDEACQLTLGGLELHPRL